MKKKIKNFFTVILVIFIFLTCFSFVITLIRKDTDSGQVNIVDKRNHGEYTFEIVEKSDSFYYPTLSGYIALINKPTKITVDCNNTEKNVEIKSLKNQNGYWIVNFNEEIIYSSLTRGNHSAVINVYSSSNKIYSGSTSLVADDDYFASFGNNGGVFDGEEPNYIFAMDKDSNWTEFY